MHLCKKGMIEHVATVEWKEIFPTARVTHLQSTYCDHVLILITTHDPNQPNRRRRIPKRFEEKWATKPDSERVIQEAWMTEVGQGSPISILFEKIKKTRFALVTWSRVAFDNSKIIIQEKKKQLEALCSLNSADQLQAIKGLKFEINDLLHQEELAWRQRSWSIWLPAGDKNTKFFHQWVSHRRHKNQILGIFDEEGNWNTIEGSIAQTTEHYFQHLFTSSNPNEIEGVLNSVDKRVTPSMNASPSTVYSWGG